MGLTREIISYLAPRLLQCYRKSSISFRSDFLSDSCDEKLFGGNAPSISNIQINATILDGGVPSAL